MKDSLVQWAIQSLNSHGYEPMDHHYEIVQETPWSTVLRIHTHQGLVYLKTVPPALMIESTILDILDKNFNAPVARLISYNNELNCFLMEDVGIQLFEFFKKKFEPTILIEAMYEYTQLQIKASQNIKMFLDVGVPDWRVEKLSSLYQQLIEQESLLLNDGLSADEIAKLHKLTPKFVSMCEKLSTYQIKDTFGHADFHDKNILINTRNQKSSIIDLGEVVITHPFFSLHNCLYRTKVNSALSLSEYQQLIVHCFEPWLALETEEHLFEIDDLINQCWSIHAVLAEFRLLNSVGRDDYHKLKREGRLSNNLRAWIMQ